MAKQSDTAPVYSRFYGFLDLCRSLICHPWHSSGHPGVDVTRFRAEFLSSRHQVQLHLYALSGIPYTEDQEAMHWNKGHISAPFGKFAPSVQYSSKTIVLTMNALWRVWKVKACSLDSMTWQGMLPTLMRPTASWACIMRMDLEGWPSEISCVEPRYLARNSTPSIRTVSSSGSRKVTAKVR